MKEKARMICKLEEFAAIINNTHAQWRSGMLTSMEEMVHLMKKATTGSDLELNGWKACMLADAIANNLTPDAVETALKAHTKIILGID